MALAFRSIARRGTNPSEKSTDSRKVRTTHTARSARATSSHCSFNNLVSLCSILQECDLIHFGPKYGNDGREP